MWASVLLARSGTVIVGRSQLVGVWSDRGLTLTRGQPSPLVQWLVAPSTEAELPFSLNKWLEHPLSIITLKEGYFSPGLREGSPPGPLRFTFNQECLSSWEVCICILESEDVWCGDHLPWPRVLHVALKSSLKFPAASTKDGKK